MTYDQQTGNVVLTINQIGPGDEGEYTCSARNQYGEAICSVFIQPEGKIKLLSKYAELNTYKLLDFHRSYRSNTARHVWFAASTTNTEHSVHK
jgi:hypothetical protein